MLYFPQEKYIVTKYPGFNFCSLAAKASTSLWYDLVYLQWRGLPQVFDTCYFFYRILDIKNTSCIIA